jgi:hypothetical protein
MKVYSCVIIMVWLLILNGMANAAEQKAADNPLAYPYVLSVPKGTKIDNTYKFPALRYKKIAASNKKLVIVRAAWVTEDTKRTELNAGTEPLTLITLSGTLKPEKWGNTLGLLLSAFGVKGKGTLSFALFDYELINADKKNIDLESSRLSPWLDVPAHFK